MTGRWNGPVAATTVVGVDHALRRFDTEAGPADASASHVLDLHATSGSGASIISAYATKVIGNHPPWAQRHRARQPENVHAREPVMPGRTVGDQGVPSFRAPALGDAVPLQNEVRHAAGAQVLAHGQAGLPAADHQRLYLFNRHLRVLLRQCEVFSPSEPQPMKPRSMGETASPLRLGGGPSSRSMQWLILDDLAQPGPDRQAMSAGRRLRNPAAPLRLPLRQGRHAVTSMEATRWSTIA